MASAKQGNQLQLATLIFFILGNLLLGSILEYFSLSLPFTLQIIISQWGFVGLTVVVYLLLTKSTINPTLLLYKPHIIDILISIGIAFSIMPLLWVINVASQFFVTNSIASSLNSSTDIPFLIILFLAAITPAFLEELLTRSLIIHNFKHHPVFIVALVSGMFFGFIHLNINQFLYAFVMGTIMCYVVIITGSVINSMVIHFTINASGITTLYLFKMVASAFKDIPELQEAMANTTPSNSELVTSLLVVTIIALVFTPIAILLIHLLLKRHNRSFKDSLTLPACEFMGTNLEPSTYNVDFYKKIITPTFILTATIFTIFVILFEFILMK